MSGILSAFSLKNRVAVVTGGYGHLGRSICLGLADAGAHVIVGGKEEAKFRQAFSPTPPANLAFAAMDVASSDSIRDVLGKVRDEHGGIDVLVNNAFYSRGGRPEELSDEDWKYGIDGTLGSVFRCMREAIPYMRPQRGSVINVGSIYGTVSPDFRIYEDHEAFFNPANYGAAKAGIVQLTRYFAVYLAGRGVRVNCVSPGSFPSDDVHKDQAFMTKLENKIPLGRTGKPEELQGIMVFLASDASSYMTGQNIVIDGGWTAW